MPKSTPTISVIKGDKSVIIVLALPEISLAKLVGKLIIESIVFYLNWSCPFFFKSKLIKVYFPFA